jgi:DNA polymerase V
VLFALVDCADFFVSCERVFDPALRDRPVAVLSNNDGCVIARSREVKALGVPMGAPFYQWRARLDAAGAVVFSANFALYGDLSHRVMEALRTFPADVEVYSIDEAFLALPDQPREDAAARAREIARRVKRWTGVPVRVGIARTKTLAKAASEAAKQAPDGTCVLAGDPRAVLAGLPVEEVWGVGRRTAPRLRRLGLTTALDLRERGLTEARSLFNVTGLRTVYELRGVSCNPLERAPPPRRSITHSRSFGRRVTTEAALREALAAFAARAAEKARKLGLAAGALQVFVTTARHAPGPAFADACTVRLPAATNATPALIAAAARALDRIWREGPAYAKAGVLLLDLARAPQTDLFDGTGLQADVHRALDAVNRRFGPGTLAFASTGLRPRAGAPPAWHGRRDRRSPLFTTRWAELPRVKAS